MTLWGSRPNGDLKTGPALNFHSAPALQDNGTNCSTPTIQCGAVCRGNPSFHFANVHMLYLASRALQALGFKEPNSSQAPEGFDPEYSALLYPTKPGSP